MAPRKKPNILIIGIDSLRADHMSCYGYDRLTTPHMDRFAQLHHRLHLLGTGPENQ